MASVLLGVACAALAFSSAHGQAQNQLDTARIPQQAQRGEFGITGPDSAFKFRFADPVRFDVSHNCSTTSSLRCEIPLCPVSVIRASELRLVKPFTPTFVERYTCFLLSRVYSAVWYTLL
jgi:hypothetical protein